MQRGNLIAFGLVDERRKQGHKASNGHPGPIKLSGVLQEDAFHAILAYERRRAERSDGTARLERLTPLISGAIRETDVIGWYEQGVTLGVIFTQLSATGKDPVTEVLHSNGVK